MDSNPIAGPSKYADEPLTDSNTWNSSVQEKTDATGAVRYFQSKHFFLYFALYY